jgi:putative cardiolipin synthase
VQAIHSERDQAKPEAVQAYDSSIQKIVDNAHAKQNPYVLAVEQSENTLLPNALQGMLWGDVSVVSDPENKINHSPKSHQIRLSDLSDSRKINPNTAVFNRFTQMLREAKREVVIANAYVLPGEELTELLEGMPKRGIQVTLVTNSLESNDVPFVMAHYDKYRERLIKAGVQWYELRGFPYADKVGGKNQFYSNGASRLALHTKAMVVDGEKAFVGSMNLDPRSIVWNAEMGVFINNPTSAQQLRGVMLNATQPAYSYEVQLNEHGQMTWSKSPTPSQYDIKHSADRAPTTEAGGFWRRLQKRLIRIVPETYM